MSARDNVVVPFAEEKNRRGGGSGPGGGGGDRDESDWRSLLTYTKDHNTQATLHNLTTILENDVGLEGLIGLDEFANRVTLHRDPPWTGGSRDEFSELDGAELAAWLGHPAGYKMVVKSSMVLEAVEAVARRHKFHPVKDYLNGLTWDGEARIDRLFIDHCGTMDDAYHKRVAAIFMLSAAARILRPGCKVDTMLVLEGEQGLGKTRVTQALFGGDRWYMDAQRSPAEKDFYQDIVGKWGVEIGEMTSFSKAEANKVKQTLSATSDTYRPSYGRYSRTFPRQCVFVGTTNEHEWQRDHTGGRRYLPVQVMRMDVVAIEGIRDQLWAEAVARLKQGEGWWELPEKATEAQDERYIEDAWSQPMLIWLSGLRHSESYKDLMFATRGVLGDIEEVTVADLMVRALHIDTGRISRADQMRVAAILTKWRWTSYRTRKFGPLTRLWYAPHDWEPLKKPPMEVDPRDF